MIYSEIIIFFIKSAFTIFIARLTYTSAWQDSRMITVFVKFHIWEIEIYPKSQLNNSDPVSCYVIVNKTIIYLLFDSSKTAAVLAF